MALAASQVIDRVAKTLLDDTNVRWSAAELLDYLNAGITTIVNLKPDVYVVSGNMTPTANSARQTIPAGGVMLFSVNRTLINGASLRQVDMNHLDNSVVGWRGATGTPEVWCHDPRDRKVFYLYPLPTVTTSLDISYAAVPTRLVSAASTIPLDDSYETALYFYVLALTYAKNATRGDEQKSTGYLNVFNIIIGANTKVQFELSPAVPAQG